MSIKAARGSWKRHPSEYKIWWNMISRCEDKNHKSYAYYGGRGIAVSEEWRTSFATFLADVGIRPSPLHTLDRIENNLGYCKSNCRWATRREQRLNMRRVHLLTFAGKTQCLTDWARQIGITPKALRDRLARHPVEDCLATPRGVSPVLARFLPQSQLSRLPRP